MTQTVNNQKNNTPQKQNRPGQRQQERLVRLARRHRRQRIWASVITALIIIALTAVSFWQYQRITAQQNADRAAKATATAVKAAATAKAHANATATVITQNCFVSPPGTQT